MIHQQRTHTDVWAHSNACPCSPNYDILGQKRPRQEVRSPAQTCADRLGERKMLRNCHWSSIDAELGNSAWYVLKPFACNLSYVIQVASWISSHRAEVSQFDEVRTL